MKRSQECESVILVPPLQFNEGFFSDPISFYHTTFKPAFLSVQDGYVIDINLMSTRNYVLEDCWIIFIVTRSTVLLRTILLWMRCLTNICIVTSNVWAATNFIHNNKLAVFLFFVFRMN